MMMTMRSTMRCSRSSGVDECMDGGRNGGSSVVGGSEDDLTTTTTTTQRCGGCCSSNSSSSSRKSSVVLAVAAIACLVMMVVDVAVSSRMAVVEAFVVIPSTTTSRAVIRQPMASTTAMFVVSSPPTSTTSPTTASLEEENNASVHKTIDASSSTTSSSESPLYCCPTTIPWEVHKFGGASLATAELYRTVGDLLIQEASRNSDDAKIPTMAIVSAKAGMTDLLVKVVDSALVDFEQAQQSLQDAVQSQIVVLTELVQTACANSQEKTIDARSIIDPIVSRIETDAQDILSIVQSLRLLRTVPAVTMEVVTGYGEIWSAQTLAAYLQTQQQQSMSLDTDWIDARDILIVKSDSSGLGEKGSAATAGVLPLWDATSTNLNAWWQQRYSNTETTDTATTRRRQTVAPILIVTGFVAKTMDGIPTTLKRSGSDYSATIFAKLVGASRVTMWKNTNGVYTADPRAVPEAFSIASLKYDEAAELAYFGAQVLHPSAMIPCIEMNIPVYVRNIFNPAFAGTVITGRCRTLKEAMNDTVNIKNWRSKSGEIPIKGITSVDKTALVTLEGASSLGGANVAERFMGAMTDAGINVMIITQASSEGSITVAVPENQGALALAALEQTFELELTRSTIGSVSLATGMSIVAIVGEGMALTSGVSATFMSSLSRANVNIRLIAQGSSERQIAVVVSNKDTSSALRAAHMAFTLSETVASVTLLGSRGHVGRALCQQIQSQRAKLAQDLGVGVSVTVAACSSSMAFCKDSRGLDLSSVSDMLQDETSAEPLDLDKITAVMQADINPLRVIVDCTNSDAVGDYYERWLAMGANIISPGRRVGSGNMDRYRRICKAQRENSVHLYLDSSVGNALPIISTLHDLLETGDTIRSIGGSLSGTMAYVLSTFSDEVSFSEALRGAIERDIPENDFRVDLSGLDMAQKVVILAREAGLEVNIEDVEVENLLPDEIASKTYTNHDDMLEDVRTHLDGPMLERYKVARDAGHRLRYKFVIDVDSGKCKCWLDSVTNTDPLYRLKSNENLVAFDTSRYETSPLIVKGASAGPELAASAIFADLIRLTRAYSSYQG